MVSLPPKIREISDSLNGWRNAPLEGVFDPLENQRIRRTLAASLGALSLDPEDHGRLQSALLLTEEDSTHGMGGWTELFIENGLAIRPAKELPRPYQHMAKEHGYHQHEHPYKLDFTPNGLMDPTHRTSSIVAGLTALEDYTFLVRLGVLPKPDTLFGYTNERMAHFAAKRAGFQAQRSRLYGAWKVVGSYDDVDKAIIGFDPALRQRLIERNSRESCKGSVADTILNEIRNGLT